MPIFLIIQEYRPFALLPNLDSEAVWGQIWEHREKYKALEYFFSRTQVIGYRCFSN